MKKLVPEDAMLIPDNAQRVFTGQIFEVWQWPQRLYDGSDATFEMLKRPDTVQVLGVVDDELLVLHDEQPHRGVKLSFPGGRVDPGESIEEAARREALEETGYEFREWRLVEVVQPHSKIEWFVYTFVAWDVERSTDTNHDAGEKITVEAKPFAEVKKLVMDRSGYLAESEALFSDANGVDDLSRLPEARGKLVERPV